jgi:hypothetical protein
MQNFIHRTVKFIAFVLHCTLIEKELSHNLYQIFTVFEACELNKYIKNKNLNRMYLFYRVFEYTSDAKPQTSLPRFITSELTL